MGRKTPKKIDPPISAATLELIVAEAGLSLIAPEAGVPAILTTLATQMLTPEGIAYSVQIIKDITTIIYNFLQIYKTWRDLGFVTGQSAELLDISKSLKWKDADNNEHSLAELLARVAQSTGGLADSDRNENFNSLIQVLKKALLKTVNTPLHDNEEIGLIQTQIVELPENHMILIAEALSRLLNDSEVRAVFGGPYNY